MGVEVSSSYCADYILLPTLPDRPHVYIYLSIYLSIYHVVLPPGGSLYALKRKLVFYPSAYTIVKWIARKPLVLRKRELLLSIRLALARRGLHVLECFAAVSHSPSLPGSFARGPNSPGRAPIRPALGPPGPAKDQE